MRGVFPLVWLDEVYGFATIELHFRTRGKNAKVFLGNPLLLTPFCV